MKILKNRLFIAGICLILAFFMTFVLAPLLNKSANRLTPVVQVIKPLSKGQKITTQNVKIAYVTGESFAEAESDLALVVDKYSKSDLSAGNIIMKDNVTDMLDSMLKLDALNGEYMAISFTSNTLASSLSSQLRSGDIISILGYIDGVSTLPPELKYVEIISCVSSDAKNADEAVDNIISTITVFASEEQALKIVDMKNKNPLHTALVYRGSDDTTRQKLLDTQKAYIQEKYGALRRDSEDQPGTDTPTDIEVKSEKGADKNG